MQTQTPPCDALFSADGYAVEQTRAAHLAYGRFGSHYNGCGWMAAYNILHALGFCPNADKIRTDLARGLWLGGKLGTGPLRLARYLRAQGLGVRLTLRRSTAFRLAQSCRAGAVLYGNTGRIGAHYVAFAPETAQMGGAAQAHETMQTKEPTQASDTVPLAQTALMHIAAQGGDHPTVDVTQRASILQHASTAQHASNPQHASVVISMLSVHAGTSPVQRPPDAQKAEGAPAAQPVKNAPVPQPVPSPRALRFFNVRAGSPVLLQTLPDFCAGACVHTPALFLFVK